MPMGAVGVEEAVGSGRYSGSASSSSGGLLCDLPEVAASVGTICKLNNKVMPPYEASTITLPSRTPTAEYVGFHNFKVLCVPVMLNPNQ